MHWSFQRSLKSGKVKIYLEQDPLVQIPYFAVRKEGGKSGSDTVTFASEELLQMRIWGVWEVNGRQTVIPGV